MNYAILKTGGGVFALMDRRTASRKKFGGIDFQNPALIYDEQRLKQGDYWGPFETEHAAHNELAEMWLSFTKECDDGELNAAYCRNAAQCFKRAAKCPL